MLPESFTSEVSMKIGDIVKFKDGLYEDENGQRYILIELNGDRCIIKHISDLPIPGTSVALVAELEVINS